MTTTRGWAGRVADLAGMLAIRRWAVDVLTGGGRTAPPGTARQWRLVLRAEACAMPLTKRLRAVAGPLPDPASAALVEQARVERGRIFSAHRQLALLATISRDRAMPLIVLKGGAAVGDGDAIDLLDLDVLPPPGRAHELTAALHDAGYATPWADSPAHHHLAPRVQPGAIRIEVHEALRGVEDPIADLFARAVPVQAYAPLLRLGAADELWYLLCHACIQHPERRGRLRDALLLSRTAARCSDEARAAVDRRIGTSARAEPLRAAFAATGGPHTLVAAAFDPAVAARYALLARLDRAPDRPAMRALVTQTMVMVSSERAWLTELHVNLRVPRDTPSMLANVARLEAAAPRLGRLARLGAALGRGLLTLPLAADAHVTARRALRTAPLGRE